MSWNVSEWDHDQHMSYLGFIFVQSEEEEMRHPSLFMVHWPGTLVRDSFYSQMSVSKSDKLLNFTFSVSG